MSLIMMSVSGGMMIAAVLIIRKLTKHYLPKRTFLVLWGAVLFRLLIPFSLPARFSVFSLLERINKRLFLEGLPSMAVNSYPLQTDVALLTFPSQPMTEMVAAQAVTATELPLLLTTWLAGMILFGLFFTISYFRYKNKLKQGSIVQDERIDACMMQYRLKRRITVGVSNEIASPLAYGVWRPVILLPRSMDITDTAVLEWVLAHEITHIKRFDQVKKFLTAAAVCVHWFNPLVWIMFWLINRDIEIACDEGVVRKFGIPFKSAYATILLGMEERKNQFGLLYSGFSKYFIEERIYAIMKHKKTTLGGLILALIMVLGITAAFATSASRDEVIKLADESVKIITGYASGEYIRSGSWNTGDPHFPTGLSYFYSNYYAAAIMPVNDYYGYYLVEPVELGDDLYLRALMFTDYKLQVICSIGNQSASLENVFITGADGTLHKIGGDGRSMEGYSKWDFISYPESKSKWTYIFNPSPEITLHFDGAVYEIKLAPIPREYHYAAKYRIKLYEDVLAGVYD
jgi:beta-lactamase regulating signal transducer with metallopeptidase domain